MLRLALRGVAARPRRAIACGFAVFLGVALAAGSLVLTGSIDRSLASRTDAALAGVAVAVSPKPIVDAKGELPPPLPAALVDALRAVDGVDAVAGQVFSPTRVVDAQGRAVGTVLAPDLLTSTVPARFHGRSYGAGRAPRTAGEAALDATSARRAGVGVGDRIRLAGKGTARSYRLVGLVPLGDTPYVGGAEVVLTRAEAARVTGKSGRVDRVLITGGPSPVELRERIAGVIPSRAEALTAADLAERRADQARASLGVVRGALSAFAAVSLFISGFLIFNTFSITVAQRTRELALLRMLGGSRVQLLGLVVLEALAIGACGSLLGLIGGLAAVPLLRETVEAFEVAVPFDGIVVSGGSVLGALALGLAATVASALLPAWRATRVAPVEALTSTSLPDRRRGPAGMALAVLALAAGVGLFVWSLVGDLGLAAYAPGSLAVLLIGVAVLGSWLVVPLASLVGMPAQLAFGVTGRLARRNLTRQPGRTAIAAAALTIGVTIIAFGLVSAHSYERSAVEDIDLRYRGEIAVQGLREGATVPAAVEPAVRQVPGVAAVGALAVAPAGSAAVPDPIRVNGIDPSMVSRVLRFDWAQGSAATLERLSGRQAIIEHPFADLLDAEVGDMVSMQTPIGSTARYRIVGVVNNDPTNELGELIVTRQALRRDFGEDPLLALVAALRRGADLETVKRDIETLVRADFPGARVYDRRALKQLRFDEATEYRRMIFAALSLAILVSVLGIANALSLSIHERTREIGLLRAIGAARTDVGSIVAHESLATALLGGLVGVGLGTALGAVFAAPLAEDHGFRFEVPVAELVAVVVSTVVAGALAAAAPARAAAETPILEAVTAD